MKTSRIFTSELLCTFSTEKRYDYVIYTTARSLPYEAVLSNNEVTDDWVTQNVGVAGSQSLLTLVLSRARKGFIVLGMVHLHVFIYDMFVPCFLLILRTAEGWLSATKAGNFLGFLTKPKGCPMIYGTSLQQMFHFSQTIQFNYSFGLWAQNKLRLNTKFIFAIFISASPRFYMF